ncbi:alpha/beta hydrolase [Candidatus Chlamydia corallus]|uniref:alpha/beta hydrolase n=1 Tax=Candidatus Chlamydia corallus TaxID=2038470 RepID=UPI000C2FB254|nr:alpha/beta hydrolase [Candidatus Chlamydia corallus]
MITGAVLKKHEQRTMFSLTLLNNFTTFGILHTPLHFNPPYPTVILLHGLASDKTGSKRSHVSLAYELTRLGIAALRVDLLGHGDCEGRLTDFSLENYKQNIREVIDYFYSLPHLDPEKLAIFGSSIGGTLALLALLSCKKIKALALWAPTISGKLMSMEAKKNSPEAITINEKGEVTYAGLTLNSDFYSQFLKIDILKELVPYARNLPRILYMQGEKDSLVSINHQKLFLQAFGNKDKQLTILTYPDVDHAFPLSESSALLDLTQWLKKELTFRE